MDDLGPNITIEWYRSDNMAALVATGHTLTIPALTAADFTNQYKVVIKIAGNQLPLLVLPTLLLLISSSKLPLILHIQLLLG